MVEKNRVYTKFDIFHTPFNLRNKISTSRYSIAGYPSLYVSFSPELCLAELDYKVNPGRYIGARFELKYDNAKVNILDLGVKPSDFFEFWFERKQR